MTLLRKYQPAPVAPSPTPVRKKATPQKRSPAVAINTEKILARINQLQRCIIVHSVIYYRLDMNLIEDTIFDHASKELVDLQEKHRELAEKSACWEQMKDFEGSTGYHLATPEFISANPWALEKAQYLLKIWTNSKKEVIRECMTR